jgi:chromate transporter
MSDPSSSPDALPRPASPTALFWACTVLALHGFGGVLTWAQRILVEQKGWLKNDEFAEMLALAQVLPGPNICNLSLMIGDKFFGLRGALAALAGMLSVPLVIALALAALYGQFAQWPAVQGAMSAVGAVTSGLIMAMALKLAMPQRKHPMGLPLAASVGAVAFVAVGVMRWPLLWVLLALGPASVAFTWWRLRQRAQAITRSTAP